VEIIPHRRVQRLADYSSFLVGLLGGYVIIGKFFRRPAFWNNKSLCSPRRKQKNFSFASARVAEWQSCDLAV